MSAFALCSDPVQQILEPAQPALPGGCLSPPTQLPVDAGEGYPWLERGTGDKAVHAFRALRWLQMTAGNEPADATDTDAQGSAASGWDSQSSAETVTA